MAWICYLLGVLAFTVDPVVGSVIFVIGMLIHWKFWIVGIIAFLVGAGWQKPSL